MDKLREFWRLFRRVHFWVITSLITVLSLVFWIMAVSALEKEKDDRVTEIEGLFNQASSLAGEPRVPNDKVAGEMDKLISQRQEEIRVAWQVKYDQQNSEETGILTWPELNPRFVRKVTPLRPIEKLPHPLPQRDDRRLNLGDREAYLDYLNKELHRLAETIGAEWMPTGQSGGRSGYASEGRPGGFGAASGETLATQSIVKWAPENQTELMAEHFTFGDAMGMGGAGGEYYGGEGRGPTASSGDDSVPDTIEILYAQEDLWVLRSLMKIIERSNAGATSRFNAAVKEIKFIRIGRNAAAKVGQVTVVKTSEEEAAAVGTGMPGQMGMGEGGMGMGSYEMMGRGEGGMGMGSYEMMGRGEGGMMGGAVVVADPADQRYVDKNYEPLEGATLRQVLSSTESMDPQNAYLAVAKRIPVRMRISVDQKKLPRFLVECANAELTVEVRQLRLNPGDDGMMPGGMGMGMGMGRGEMSSAREPGLRGMGQSGSETNPFPFDVTAEIYGIIYLYNPVDNRAMGIEGVDSADEVLDPNSVTQNVSSGMRG